MPADQSNGIENAAANIQAMFEPRECPLPRIVTAKPLLHLVAQGSFYDLQMCYEDRPQAITMINAWELAELAAGIVAEGWGTPRKRECLEAAFAACGFTLTAREGVPHAPDS